ncbi:MAG: RNA polymerase sigma factor [Nitrospirota bacterium]
MKDDRDEKHDRFVEYYHKYKDKIFNYLMYRVQFDRALAEDLLMDVFMKGYENFDKYSPEKGTFKSWIFTIAHNHLVDCWRKLRKQMVSTEALAEKGIELAVDSDLDKKADLEIEKQKVQKVLLLMSEQESELIALKFIHDFTNEEIVHLLGRREGAIRTALHRSLNRFRSLYQKLYPSSNFI